MEWKYFFGTPGYRYYHSEINGVRVEKLSTKQGNYYSVGNIDNAKKRYKTEEELIKEVKG